jgi:two-component SAPR family response regulator
MSNKGPLILVDDDPEDQELVLLAFRELGFKEEIKTFNSAADALSFLYDTEQEPFLIVSDVNMPKMDGISFKKKIDECRILSIKCIPFVFLSTSTQFVQQTCELNIQGYFEKGTSWEQLCETMKIILQYWKSTRHIRTN